LGENRNGSTNAESSEKYVHVVIGNQRSGTSSSSASRLSPGGSVGSASCNPTPGYAFVPHPFAMPLPSKRATLPSDGVGGVGPHGVSGVWNTSAASSPHTLSLCTSIGVPGVESARHETENAQFGGNAPMLPGH
jgi:hypothetical protein